MVSHVAVHEAGHCIVAFNLGLRIEKVSISNETGFASVLVNQIEPSEELNELLEKAKLLEKKEMVEKEKLDKLIEEARLNTKFGNSQYLFNLNDMLKKATLGIPKQEYAIDKNDMLKKTKLGILEQEYAILNERLENERAIILREIEAAREHEKLVEKSEDSFLDVLLAGWAAERALKKEKKEIRIKRNSYDQFGFLKPGEIVFVKPGKIDPNSEEAFSKRAEDDCRKYDNIMDSRKNRLDIIKRASASANERYVTVQQQRYITRERQCYTTNLLRDPESIVIGKSRQLQKKPVVEKEGNVYHVYNVVATYFGNKIQKATLIRLAKEIDSKKELCATYANEIISKKPKKLWFF